MPEIRSAVATAGAPRRLPKIKILAVGLLLFAVGLWGVPPAEAKTETKKATHQTVKKAAKKTKKVTRVTAPAFRNMPTTATSSSRYADLIIDANSGEILHQENADAPRRPASLTKIMTLYLTFQALDAGRLRLETMLPVSSLAAAQSPTKLGLRAGQRVSAEDLILGLVTESANDASVVLAEAIGGSVDGFADRMTRTARGLGMASTTYSNPNGLPDPGQVTTARDQARLALAIQRHFPRYYHYFSTPSFQYGGRLHPNHNRLMARYEGMDGIKTGFIRESGFNLVASVKRGNKRLIGVIFGGSSAASRDNQLAALLDAAFERAGDDNSGQLPRTQTASAKNNSYSGVAAPTYAPVQQAQPTQPAQPARAEVTSTDADIVAAAQGYSQSYGRDYARDSGQGDAEYSGESATLAAVTARAVQPQVEAQPEARSSAPALQSASAASTLQLPKAATARTPRSAEAVSKAKPAATGSGWGIQIGAYNDRASGQRATALVADSMPDVLGGAAPRVLSVAASSGTIYRARLVGLGEKDARTACNRLQAKSRPCLTLPPGNGGGGNNAWLASAGE